MKKFFTLLLLAFTTCLYAQVPVNDDCDGLIDLGVAPACPDSIFFTNVNATASDIGFGNIPICFNGGTVQNDVWFAFTTSDTIFDYTIAVTGITDGMGSEPMSNPQVALYRGSCEVDGLAELLCEAAEPGENVVELDAEGLTPNTSYFIRINDFSASATPNWGTFQLCVDEKQPVSTIDEGFSDDCVGQLFDSGGPDGDYENNENFVFTICPEPAPAPPSCINFTLEYFNIEYVEFGTTDQLILYDGDTPNPNTEIAVIGGGNFGNNTAGGGAVCFQAQASSGCLTVQFISDASNAFEGFSASWECSYGNDCDPPDPITVDTDISNEQIENFVASPQTVVTVTDINCPDGAYGLFEAGDDTDLGLERGLLLTSGDVNWAPGPNTSGGGGNPNASNNAPGDPELDSLSIYYGDGDLSNDACVIELDVLAATTELEFEYVFGSDEYPEFVNDFNDIFAFLISGPGIVGDPVLNGQRNIAVLPDGNNTLVEINSVNNVLNWEYYRNNQLGQSVEYDGLTSDFLGVKKSLTARAQVQPCSTYHLKLAIADRGDFVWDSGVFVSEIRGGTPDLSVTFNSGIDYLIEDCTNSPDLVTIELDEPLENTTTYFVRIEGTAELGIDYTLDIPDSLVFLPGETMVQFPIVPLSDLENEPIESILITLFNDLGCGEVTYAELEVELHDALNVQILLGQDTAQVCQDSSAFLFAEGAATYFWTPISILDNPTSDMPVATPTQSIWVTVEGNVGTCQDTDSIFLELISPQIQISTEDPTAICQGDTISLTVTNNANDSNLQWGPAEGLSDPNSPTPLAFPETTTEYTATIDIFGCQVSDTIVIDVSPFDFPQVTGDTTICENYPVTLAEAITNTTTTYEWSPAETLDDPLISNALATPEETTTYQLIAVSGNEACADTTEVTVTVLAADVAIQNPDSTEICLDEVVNLSAVISADSTDNLIWSPDNGTLSDTSGLNVQATPQVSQWYFATFQIGECVVFDSMYVRVDSLPESLITPDPVMDPYCAGEIVQLTSPTYDPSAFPDIEHLWQPDVGFETPDSLWNMVLTTQDTTTYLRITNNRGCVDTAAITLNVYQPPQVFVTPADTTICFGESVQLQFSVDGEAPESIEWTPEDGTLSCLDCFTPVATPNGTTTYTVMTEYPACPPSASATITVIPEPVIQPNPGQICLGEFIQLNLAADTVSTYSWSSPDDPDFSSSDPFLAVSPAETTTYVLTVNRDPDCPSVEVEIAVEVIQEPTLTVSDDAVLCFGDGITLNAETDAPASVPEFFLWTFDGQTEEGATLDIDAVTSPTTFTLTYTYGPDGSCGTLTETVAVDLDLEVVIDTIQVDPPEFDSTLVIPGGIPFELFTDFTPMQPGFSTEWTWTGQGSPGTDEGTTLVPAPLPPPGDYTYFFTVTTELGCTFTNFIDLTILEPLAEMPNAFTPNEDGDNDTFGPVTFGGITVTEFKVFNRWGQQVYDNETPETGWDGTNNGNPAPSDVYMYMILIESPALVEPIKLQGEVVLLR